MAHERRDSIKLRVENKDYEVVGGSFSDLLSAVKNLPGRRFVGQQKLWVVPGSLAMVRGQLENSGYTLEGGTPVSPEEAQANLFNDSIKFAVAGYQAEVSGAEFQQLLAVIKEVPGRRFDGESKLWSLPGSLTEIKNHFEKKGLSVQNITAAELSAPADNAPVETSTPPTPPPLFDDMPPPQDDPAWNLDDGVDYGGAEDVPPPPEAESAPRAPSFSGKRDQIKVRVGDLNLVVVGGSFQEMLAAIKDIPDRRFDGESKQWLLPDDINSIQQHLNSKGYQLEEWQS